MTRIEYDKIETLLAMFSTDVDETLSYDGLIEALNRYLTLGKVSQADHTLLTKYMVANAESDTGGKAWVSYHWDLVYDIGLEMAKPRILEILPLVREEHEHCRQLEGTEYGSYQEPSAALCYLKDGRIITELDHDDVMYYMEKVEEELPLPEDEDDDKQLAWLDTVIENLKKELDEKQRSI